LNERRSGGRYHGSDAAAPTTVLITRTGTVAWVYRPSHILRRLSPSELAAAVDEYLPMQ
jgi:hypothetical protein